MAGHIHVLTYRWRFFVTAMETLSDQRKEKIQDMAIAVRASKMETVDFNKFIDAKPMSHDDIYAKHQAGEL